MGANAQTSVPTFTAGDVLTAANMNISARTGVPVFADTTARDAAFGGTGEKTLAEGQLCYVENLTGDAQIQYYDGSTWNSLGAAGLTLVSNTTIGSAVASVTVSSAFSSTYDNYRIVLSGGAASTATGYNMTLGATATGYYWSYSGRTFAGVASTGQGANSTSFSSISNAGTGTQHMIIDVCSPFLSKNTVVTGMTVYADASAGYQYQYGGFLNNTTSYTAFTLTTQAGTMTGGSIQVFGYKN